MQIIILCLCLETKAIMWNEFHPFIIYFPLVTHSFIFTFADAFQDDTSQIKLICHIEKNWLKKSSYYFNLSYNGRAINASNLNISNASRPINELYWIGSYCQMLAYIIQYENYFQFTLHLILRISCYFYGWLHANAKL